VKQCSKCGVVKPLDAFCRRADREDGRQPKCKACEAAYRAANAEKIAARLSEWRAANPAKVVALSVAYYAANREKILAEKSAYYAANRERILARTAEAYASSGEKRAAKAAYRDANREKIAAWWEAYSAANREAIREGRTRWASANPGKVAEAKTRRRIAESRAIPAWANISLVAAYYTMAAAMTKASGVRHEVDHIEPLRGKHVCGLHNEFNLQVVRGRENARKGNRPSDLRAPACLGPVPPLGQTPTLSKTSPVVKVL